jgi:hypothetical protein
VRKHIESYGVEIVRFGDFTISMDPADKERLDKLIERAAYANMAGGYQQMAQAEMMLGAAEGMKKGGTGARPRGHGHGHGVRHGQPDGADDGAAADGRASRWRRGPRRPRPRAAIRS